MPENTMVGFFMIGILMGKSMGESRKIPWLDFSWLEFSWVKVWGKSENTMVGFFMVIILMAKSM